MKPALLWIAQGFGVGHLKPAPGTWGSLLGLAWFVVLMWPGSIWIYCLGLVGSAALCVWLCDLAEQSLGVKDPQSVVLDEIVAMPLCFLGPVAFERLFSGNMPALSSLFDTRNLLLALVLFVGFRVFDVWKPWPARQSQRLPGGWGVTVDDLIAAGYVNLAWLIGWLLHQRVW